MNGQGAVPILGQQARASVRLAGLPIRLDEAGLMASKVVQTPQGPAVQIDRDDYVDAEELCEMIRKVVWEGMLGKIQLAFDAQVRVLIQSLLTTDEVPNLIRPVIREEVKALIEEWQQA